MPPVDLVPGESIFVLILIVLVGIPVCWVILKLITVAGPKYYNYFFKNPANLTIKILGAEIDLKVAGVAFLFLAIVIILTLLYAILRMVPGRS